MELQGAAADLSMQYQSQTQSMNTINETQGSQMLQPYAPPPPWPPTEITNQSMHYYNMQMQMQMEMEAKKNARMQQYQLEAHQAWLKTKTGANMSSQNIPVYSDNFRKGFKEPPSATSSLTSKMRKLSLKDMNLDPSQDINETMIENLKPLPSNFDDSLFPISVAPQTYMSQLQAASKKTDKEKLRRKLLNEKYETLTESSVTTDPIFFFFFVIFFSFLLFLTHTHTHTLKQIQTQKTNMYSV